MNTKVRWDLRDKDSEDKEDVHKGKEEEEIHSKTELQMKTTSVMASYVLTEKEVNMTKRRVTDFKWNYRVILPGPMKP